MTRSRLASGVLVSALAVGLLVGLPGGSAEAAPTDCPTAFPTVEAVDGVSGTGYTVERGTTPDPFTAKILGRITNGIAPGIDMIMADLDSPALERAGGVWEGMSGSPVYAGDGRLIGSVSYGLAGSSPIAGLTPAQDMLKLLTPATPVASRSTIKVSSVQAGRIARAGVSASVASQGFARLPLPVSVSGVGKGSARYLSHLTNRDDVHVLTGGARISDTGSSSPSEIFAGSNFAAALSYGDVSLAGIGTTTFVCAGQAVAFGHPLLGSGSSQYTAHPATAVYVQPSPDSPFKEANPGGPVGVVTKDKTTGLVAALGASPTSSFAVTSTIGLAGAAPVIGNTVGIYQPWAGDIVADHLQANIVRALGNEGGGSAALTFTIKGVRANGAPFTLVRSDHYADPDDISFVPSDDLYEIVSALETQAFDDLKITSVNITGSVSEAINQYRVTGLKIKKKGRWVAQKGVLTAVSGKTIPARLTLTKYRSAATITVPLTIKVPAKTKGAVGDLLISDALSGFSSGDLPSSVSSSLKVAKPGTTLKLITRSGSVAGSVPTSLTGLLKELAAAPTNDSVAGTLTLDLGSKELVSVTYKRTNGVVSEYSRDIAVRVK